MKQHLKKLIQSICALALIAHTHLIFADTTADAETVFNWAENSFPEVLPGHKATQNINPWLFRFYPETGVYVGVNITDSNVYVLGGPWGNNVTIVETLSNMVNLIQNSGGNSSVSACNTANVPDGIIYSQSGNVVTVTTNGQCILAPDITDSANSNICVIPQQPTATGISTLSSNTITSSRLSGITTTIPGLPNPFQGIIDSTASVKHCTINAAVDTANLIVNSDICLDLTEALAGALSQFPIEGIQVTPPIEYASTGTYTSQTVPDCFATDATTVTDAFTGETWIKQNGNFIQVTN
ncbi:hypothetical protein SAMN05216302_100571 [Nitrosomonas aestuarii]|uniref:Uncharacterized protein n=1 Tax=Nitrosomonas aestuarii TaxID=52441 RepID=A0A1I3Z3N7_9PROT|nr:hypothetical protein [Nitrosomonas aestuarii]SFK38675.1 hypothetical protein SAMN05216302_100571 [Nitrosomonas aestuarii]